MDVDPIDPLDVAADTSREPRAASLSTRVALTVALLATFLGVCKVKDDNIVQAMQQAQAAKLDDWNFYQARNIRQEVAQATLTELRLAAAAAPAAMGAAYQDAMKRYETIVQEQDAKKAALQKQAEAEGTRYDDLNYRDDQFDLADALIAIAISLLAVTALTHKPWLYLMALVPTAGGLVMGLAGLLGWHVHPDALARWLS